MNIIIKTKNIELTDSLRNYINKRINGLGKFLKDSSDVFVDIEKESFHHKKGQIFRTEAIVQLPGKKLVAVANGDDLGKTVTEVRDQLKEEIKKHKLKMIELPRRKIRKANEKEIF